MKIYTKIVIDIETLETLKEESYEYEGELSLCGGGGSDVEYTQSPEQREIFGYLSPLIQQATSRGLAGEPAWNVDAPPDVFDPKTGIPSMQGVLSDTPMYNTDFMQPTQQWWNNVSPDVKSGLWSPYKEAGNQLSEQLGGQGQWGSARGGPSGAAGAAMGQLMSEGAQNVPLQAWQMGQEGRAADLAKSQTGYQNQLQESMADWNRYGTDYQNQMTQWQMEQQAIQYPFTAAPGMLGGTYSQPVVNPGSPDQTGAAMGAFASIISALAMAASDIRLKKNINKIGTYKGLDVIEFEYLWGSEKNIGLIAQQVRKVKPEAVGKLPNGYLYINYALV